MSENIPDLLWETDAMVAAMQGRPVGELPVGVSGISIDSRTVSAGDAYFAIKGDLHDGHKFVSSAIKAGAGLCVVAEEKLVSLGRLTSGVIVVRDVLKAMRLLGEAARARTKAQIIAVTGSVGKTTTKEMLRTTLSASGKVHASVASFNNHWGVPLTLARMPQDTRFGVFEIGMNHPDEIRPLVKMVRPHVAMINNVAAAHLGAFKNLAEIAKAKAEIFEGIVAGGYALINKDDGHASVLTQYAHAANVEHVRSFGEKRGADYWLKQAEPDEAGTSIIVRINGRDHAVRLNVVGEHFVKNALAVLGVATLTGADMQKSVEALGDIKPEKGRGERHTLKSKSGKFLLIDESYNANPASMQAALGVLARAKIGAKGRRIAILGDMLELGKDSSKLHRDLANVISKSNVDLVLTVGSEMEVLGAELGAKELIGHVADWKSARDLIFKKVRAGDVVMLKASNGLGFANLVTAFCSEFSVGDTKAKVSGK